MLTNARILLITMAGVCALLLGIAVANAGDAKPRTASAPASQPATTQPDLKGMELDLGNGIKIKLVLIRAGKFTMGGGAGAAEPAHEVTLTKSYYMAAYMVTEEQYEYLVPQEKVARLKWNQIVQHPQYPQTATWTEAMDFCKKVSQLTGNKVRLPTEAEWEYACRAGTTTHFFFGNKIDKIHEYAWVGIMGPVGQKKPNPWGLYDMCGNLDQWCSDVYGDYTKDKATDPTGPKVSTNWHVNRGGMGGEDSTVRRGPPRDHRGGIRLVVDPPLVLPKEFTGVFKVGKSGHGRFLDVSVNTVKVTPLPSGKAVEMTIPNKPATANGPDPVEDIYKPIKDAGKDDLLKIKYLALAENVNLILSVERYIPKAGEEQPNVYVFSGKAEKKLATGTRQPVVVVTKYLQEFVFQVPLRIAKGTQRVPDAAMLKLIDSLKGGDLIEVTPESKTINTIKSIDRYTPKWPTTSAATR